MDKDSEPNPPTPNPPTTGSSEGEQAKGDGHPDDRSGSD
jgi:hypothetical protein